MCSVVLIRLRFLYINEADEKCNGIIIIRNRLKSNQGNFTVKTQFRNLWLFVHTFRQAYNQSRIPRPAAVAASTHQFLDQVV